jgi:hypothetical protein
MLLPANRVEQAWWQDHVEPHRDRPGSSLRVEFLRGRMRFHRPDWTPGPKGDRPPFGCALLIWQTPKQCSHEALHYRPDLEGLVCAYCGTGAPAIGSVRPTGGDS